MGRRSKYTIQETEKREKWRAVLYIRLSKEDGDKDESNSVVNQRGLLTHFVSQHSDLEIFDILIDDGYSGTNFERPQFKRLIQILRNGRANCVIVKDLSRLGRDYIEAGQYIEILFPLLNVRLISVNDNIDSLLSPDSTQSYILPMQDIVNDYYAKDTSIRVRQVKNRKRLYGEYTNGQPLYGYKLDPNKKGRLIPDKDSASIVQRIFSMYLSGKSSSEIARQLNAESILCPRGYKKTGQISILSEKTSEHFFWIPSTVLYILKNQMYCGDMVQGKALVSDFRNQKKVSIPKDSWSIVENTNEAIIDRDSFLKVQNIISQNRKNEIGGTTESKALFAGIVLCSECGHNLRYHGGCYYCVYSSLTAEKSCQRHSINEKILSRIVLESLQNLSLLASNMDAVYHQTREKINAQRSDFTFQKRAILSQMEETERKKRSLYVQWKMNAISKEQYRMETECLSKELENLKEKISSLAPDTEIPSNNDFIENFKNYSGISSLSKNILQALVEKIVVYPDKRVKIFFRFEDEFQKALQQYSK